ncbi:hypothetical protein DNTS_031771 [Danionella cerebrum]|uniref:Lysosomal dipeptide transporter MFSD1 n=1 Tax=Danionella cerebrum TaxID=2873325 RepID=A0A553MYU6_9TELE|nr:hypothetical protein DNTS_031771 [Danionella translucida]TRY58325.1 hypothetical protein DNTS_031771 [Danionella translucida]TRY58326.1 hypothetical protein DNTS_031771 [Danionella translucida]
MAAGEQQHRSLLADEEEDEAGNRNLCAVCDPSRLPHRIIVLSVMCFLGFGSYFCYDNPAALQSQVMQDMNLNTASFMQLYAWYSWPNVVLCFLGGFLLDRVFGIRWGTIIFSLFVLVGQIIFASGALADRFWLMEVGRFVFGIGGESLAVAQNTYAVNWFKGKELNLVFGLQLSMARLGSTVNMNVIGWVYGRIRAMLGSTGYTTLGITLMISASTCLFSLLCAFILGFLDKRAEKILNKEQGKSGEVIKLSDVRHFPFSLWLIFIICVAYYVAIFPFIGLGQVFFIEKFGFTPVQARAINSLLALTFWNPWIAMSVLGVAYSLLACALWPMVAFVVPEHQLGTAYGFMQSIQNLGLAVMSIAAGSILDSRGYLFLEVFFIASLCLALLAVVLLYFYDYHKGNVRVISWAERGSSGPLPSQEASDRLKPLSPFGVRNRYLSRLGVQMPGHCCPHLSSLAYRSVLK